MINNLMIVRDVIINFGRLSDDDEQRWDGIIQEFQLSRCIFMGQTEQQ